jgi:hypothetical protein
MLSFMCVVSLFATIGCACSGAWLPAIFFLIVWYILACVKAYANAVTDELLRRGEFYR